MEELTKVGCNQGDDEAGKVLVRNSGAWMSSDFESLFSEDHLLQGKLEFENFDNIWVADFEFFQPPGYNPSPHCAVFHHVSHSYAPLQWFVSKLSLSQDDLSGEWFPDPNYLLIAFYAPAELACYLELGWPLPKYVIDLYAEFRNLKNGLPSQKYGLYPACKAMGIEVGDEEVKGEMQQLAGTTENLTVEQEKELLKYCQSDVELTAELFKKLAPNICIEQALMRGDYMKAVAKMEKNGIPMDTVMLDKLRNNKDTVRNKIIDMVREENIYSGQTFKMNKFQWWLEEKEIRWPELPTGKPKLDQKTFENMVEEHPEVGQISEVRDTLSGLRREELWIGEDGRNRAMLSPLRSRTGRNQPSNSKFIFGQPNWMRSLIKPEFGEAIAYIDWAQQEVGIAAALSNDKNMIESYQSGDPYLEFAKIAGVIPKGATRKDEGIEEIRDIYKTCALAVQYRMGAMALSKKIKKSVREAERLLDLHHTIYPDFWKWSAWIVRYAAVHKRIHTMRGWYLHTGCHSNLRMVCNFPVQAGGAEMLRLACTKMCEAGIKVCAPVHDAVLISSPAFKIMGEVDRARKIMAEASLDTLRTLELKTDADIIRYPDRFVDKRGRKMWERIEKILGEL